MQLGVVQMKMQQRTYDQVAKLTAAVEASRAGGDEAGNTRAVAAAAGISVEEAREELSGLKEALMAELKVIEAGQRCITNATHDVAAASNIFFSFR